MTEVPDRGWSRDALVLLRMDLRRASAGASGAKRVARVCRTLAPGELLAVRLGATGGHEDAWREAGRADLRRLLCAYAPDDREQLIWAAPPELPGPAAPGPLDVRALAPPLPLVVTADVVARLEPGDHVLQVNDHHSPVLADLLEGRAAVGYDGSWTEGRVTARIVRAAPAAAADPGGVARRPGRSDLPA